MAVRSRYKSVLTSEKWNAAFGRKTTIERVLAYMIDHWDALQKCPPPDMQWSQPEPKITRYYACSLYKNCRRHGIDGIFIPEHATSDIDEEKQELSSRGRTDMTYFSEKLEHEIEIDIEIKKLKTDIGAKNSRALYCTQGALRFVNGIYAKQADLGFMIALVESSSKTQEVANGIKAGIQEKPMSQLLRALALPNGKTVTSPSKVFKNCSFETRHARDHITGRADILLGHIILAHNDN
jgi:hypothetical protein